jgi:hypothetical protein
LDDRRKSPRRRIWRALVLIYCPITAATGSKWTPINSRTSFESAISKAGSSAACGKDADIRPKFPYSHGVLMKYATDRSILTLRRPRGAC